MAKGVITCEESQTVTLAFREAGHDFRSNDLKPCSGGYPELHLCEDMMHLLPRIGSTLDFLGAHPVCKYLANSGVRWLASEKPKEGYEWSETYGIYLNMDRYERMKDAALFFKSTLGWVKTIGKGYVENPIMHKYAMEIIGERPTQIIQPWQFGHTTSKATCLWIVGLPNLIPTDVIPKEQRTQDIWLASPGPERDTIRSKTFPGIAKAMATQWSSILNTTSKD